MTLIRNAITFGILTLSVADLTKININILMNITEGAGLSGNASDLYLGGDLFESRRVHRSLWFRFFVVYLNPSRYLPG
jgi:hypothetical protein